MPTVESRTLITADGHELAADLARPDGDVIGGAAVCHPHPQFGGDRFNPVVEAAFRARAERGRLALRFDFRREFANGIGERHDVVAALDALAAETQQPLAAAGYSFGAAVALSTDDARIRAVAAVAPPLAHMEVRPPSVPTLVLTPVHDQFSDPDATAPIVAEWPDNTFEAVDSADHFLAGSAGKVGERAAEWLAGLLRA